MVEMKRSIPTGLYVHIPFCVRKCAYCDFLSFPATEEMKESYVNLLCEEIDREAVRYPNHRGTTVFFGGGTPTVLTAEQLEAILCKLKERFFVDFQQKAGNTRIEKSKKAEQNMSSWMEAGPAGGIGGKACETSEEPEITVECNPGTVTEEDLRKLRAAGFNRLSIGLQSAQNAELRKLGRIHTWEDFLSTWDRARKAGFQNINVDIMSALPGQNTKSYVNSLERVTALGPEHISAYSLIIEEGTPFYERYGEADAQRRRDGVDRAHLLPSEEEERRMYELTREILEREGYRRYEISNYARPGYECRHNIAYWRRGNYLGFGLGAASLMENCRFVKPRTLEEYRILLKKGREEREDNENWNRGSFSNDRHGTVSSTLKKDCTPKESLHRDVQQLSAQDQMEEFMFLGLRLMEGISAGEFRECFHVAIEEIYGDVLKKLEGQGLLTRRGDRIFLTERGIDVSNVVLSEFLL